MKKYLFLAIIFISSNAFAETVRVYTDYKPVRILQVVGDGNADLEASKAGLAGAFIEVDSASIPSDRTDRDFWKFESGQIQTDNLKKTARQDLKTKKQSDRDSAIEKLKALGLTEDELVTLGILKEK